LEIVAARVIASMRTGQDLGMRTSRVFIRFKNL
jgi:hypothetical protein